MLINQGIVMKKDFSLRKYWQEKALFHLYQLRILNWWSLILVGGLYILAAIMGWSAIQTRIHNSSAIVTGLSYFLLESGAGTIAGILAGSLILNDPCLELLLVSKQSIKSILASRYLLIFAVLFTLSLLYLLWSLALGITYSSSNNPAWFLFLWLAPVLLMSTIGLAVSFFTRSAPAGTVVIGLILICAFTLKDYILSHEVFRLFFIALSFYSPAASDWWWNRLVLIGCSLFFAFCCWWWLGKDERLLGTTA